MAREEVRPAVTWALERAPNPPRDPCPHDGGAHPVHHRDVPTGEPTRRAPLLARSGRSPLHRPPPVPGAAEHGPGGDARAAWYGVARAIEEAWGLPLSSPTSLRHERSRSPTRD